MLDNAWVILFILSGLIYLPLMIFWVIPKYQKELKGSLRKGYYPQDMEQFFNK